MKNTECKHNLDLFTTKLHGTFNADLSKSVCTSDIK